MNTRPPIVILTALELEYKAVRERLSGIREPPPAEGTRFEVGEPADREVVLAVTGQGTHATAVLAERAMEQAARGSHGRAEPEKPHVRVETKGGRHGAVVGLVDGGVHNHYAWLGGADGPGREERGSW